jgi:hypothetical protein
LKFKHVYKGKNICMLITFSSYILLWEQKLRWVVPGKKCSHENLQNFVGFKPKILDLTECSMCIARNTKRKLSQRLSENLRGTAQCQNKAAVCVPWSFRAGATYFTVSLLICIYSGTGKDEMHLTRCAHREWKINSSQRNGICYYYLYYLLGEAARQYNL